MKFILPLPPTTNAAYKISMSRMYKSDECKTWEESAGWSMKKDVPKQPLLGPVQVLISLYLSHWRDVDGSLKLILDLLEDQGVYKNDRQVQTVTIEKREDKENPRCEVEVLEL